MSMATVVERQSDLGRDTAMTDTQILRLGVSRNSNLRVRLNRLIRKIKRPALIYCDSQWYVGEVPELNEKGEII